MVILYIITVIVFLVLFCFLVYINARLFTYIRSLETRVEEQIKKNNNLFQSIKELVQDGFLLNDGRLKKFMIQKEKNKIYNGINVEDKDVEI